MAQEDTIYNIMSKLDLESLISLRGLTMGRIGKEKKFFLFFLFFTSFGISFNAFTIFCCEVRFLITFCVICDSHKKGATFLKTEPLPKGE